MFRIFGAAALALAAGALAPSAPRPAGRPGPNILLVTIDTLRADRVGVHGRGPSLTPNIDAWASGAAVFESAYAHTVTTLPSHVNILLGRTPPNHGVRDNANFVVPAGLPTLAGILKASGYATGAFIGGFPLDRRFGLDRGFDIYDDDLRSADKDPGIEAGRERRARAVVDSALAWVRARTGPWFLWVHCYDPHDPYSPPEPFLSRFRGAPYDGEVAYTDSVLGGLLEWAVRSRGAAGTITVLTGDHGESLGDHGERTHGYLAYNAVLRIPLIIKRPGPQGGGGRPVRSNVSHVDIFPTICQLAGVDPPSGLQGVSLLPLMDGKTVVERPIYFESLSPALNLGWAPLAGFIFGAEKFTESPLPELYDLARDPSEGTNTAAGRDLAPLRKKLAGIVRSLAGEAASGAGRTADRATRDMLLSLGYLAGGSGGGPPSARAEDDVKALLPLQNRAMDALELFNGGKPREAVDALKAIIAEGRRVGAAYLNLATIYKKQGRPEDAAAALKIGLEKLPDAYDLYIQYIEALYEAGRYGEVVAICRAMPVARASADPVYWNIAGLAFWRTGDEAEAKRCLDRSISLDGKFAVPHNSLGTLLTFVFKASGDQGDYERAVAAYARAIELDPFYAAAYHGLGVAHFQARAYEKAILGFDKALALGIGLDETHYFLGIAHFVRGEWAPALASLTAFKNSPSYARLGEAERARLDGYISQCRKF